jgi:hypothetical protein
MEVTVYLPPSLIAPALTIVVFLLIKTILEIIPL